VLGTQSITSEYVLPTFLLGSMIAAKEEVTTIRLTVGALLLIAFRIPMVPIMARLIRLGLRSLIQDCFTWVEQILFRVGDVEMKRTSSMDDSLERRIRDDGFVEG
jgi:hypothetical protein